MDYYWQTTSPREKRSSGTKIIATIIILMILISSGLAFIIQFVPEIIGSGTKVKVAVLDSGIDTGFGLQARIVAEKSFIAPQYGYDYIDVTTTDAQPEDVPHGSLTASLVADTPNTQIVNGKVIDQNGTATTLALVAAIHWAVEQNCSVISMSLGSSPVFGDPLEEAIDWAFSRGVVLVASAGNEGDSGLAGTSISSPSIFEKCLSVAALYETGQPAEFSSTGPTFNGYMKPDISADGWATFSTSRYYGTSFAAPRVAGAAAQLIGHCIDNNITHTPGAIMTALMKGADTMPNYPSYLVGVGKLNVATSVALIDNNSGPEELPELSLVFPASLPIDYEKLFFGDNYTFNIRFLTSGETNFSFSVIGDNSGIYNLPSTIYVNQTLTYPLTISVPDSGTSMINNTLQFTSPDYGVTSLEVGFAVHTPTARVAFDISHTSWDIDSHYGQFREFYKELVNNDISVTEIRRNVTLAVLEQFDSVIMLDPCVYDVNETIPNDVTMYNIPFSASEKQAYSDYYDGGGGIFFATLGESFANITEINDFLGFSGFSLTGTEIPSSGNTADIVNLDSHIITAGVSGFHYSGAVVNIPGDGTRLARYNNPVLAVLGCKEGAEGGRIVVTGTNFFIDNYALSGRYGPGDDALIALRIVLWTAGLLV
ncbi:MAG: S8 family serine peptidase [Candidatus Thorarchaeota archaeon]